MRTLYKSKLLAFRQCASSMAGLFGLCHQVVLLTTPFVPGHDLPITLPNGPPGTGRSLSSGSPP
jgi:hypothetical protein